MGGIIYIYIDDTSKSILMFLGKFHHDLMERPSPRLLLVDFREIIPFNGLKRKIQVSELLEFTQIPGPWLPVRKLLVITSGKVCLQFAPIITSAAPSAVSVK